MKQTSDGRCPVCNGDTLTLAIDWTRYYRVERLLGGKLRAEFDHEEKSDSDIDPLGPVRLFCHDCGAYLEVPEELAL